MFEQMFEKRLVGAIGAKVVDDTKDFTIPAHIPPQGNMVITKLEYPAEFTPNVAFVMHVTFRNDGGDDGYFCRIYDKDLGGVIASTTGEPPIASGASIRTRFSLKLSQTTDFHARAEVGHFE